MDVLIKDLQGNEAKVGKKPEVIDGVNIVVAKKNTDGSTSKFFQAYEVSTGHWCGIGSTVDEAISHVKKNITHIKSVLGKNQQSVGGLFGDVA